MIDGMKVMEMLIQKMKSLIINIKSKYCCDHTFETVRRGDFDGPIMYHVCTKCGKVVFGEPKKWF